MAAFKICYAMKKLKLGISAIDVHNEYLYYGDDSGTLYAFEFAIKNLEVQTTEKAKTRIAKSKIDCIKAFKTLNFLAVLSEGRLYVVETTNLKTEYILSKDGVTCFAMNNNDIIAIATGKKITIKLFDSGSKKFLSKVMKTLSPEPILKLTWNDNYLGIAHKKAYFILNTEEEKEKELCNIGVACSLNMVVYNEKWLVIDEDVVAFYNKVGEPLSKTIEMKESIKVDPLVSMIVANHYLLLFREDKVEIFNLKGLAKIHEIAFEKWLYKNAVVAGDHIILAMGTKEKKGGISKSSTLSYMNKIPIEDQIEYLLATSKVLEAREVFAQNYSDEEDYERKKEVFEIDAGWAYIINLDFEQVTICFSSANFDPRDLLTLVPEVLDPEYKSPRYFTLEMFIKKKHEDLEEKKEEGINMILNLVRMQHDNLLKKYNGKLKEKVKFVWPSLPMNDFFKGKENTLYEVLSVLETSLIRLYMMKQDSHGLKEFVDSLNELYVNYKEFESYLEKEIKDKPKNYTLQVCQVVLQEKQRNYEGALAIWKQLSLSDSKSLSELACKAMVELLRNKVKNKTVIQNYARVVLVVSIDEGLRIFTDNPNMQEIMTEDEIFNYLSKQDQYRQGVKQQYLEYLVRKPDTEERFFTFLGLHYIAKVEEAKELEKKLEGNYGLKDDSELLSSKYRDTLKVFLKEYSSYSAQTLLEKIELLDLFDERILIYSKLKMYRKVLKLLVERGKDSLDFEPAEKYCREESEPLFDILFEMVLELYTSKRNTFWIKSNEMQSRKSIASTVTQSEIDALKKYVMMYEKYCKEFLTRYAGNEKMNAVKVINLIPPEWNVKDGQDDLLFSYLILTLNDRINKNTNTEIARQISETEKLELQGKQARLKKPYVMLTESSRCKICGDLLSMKAFYVYPNGEVTHMKCAKDLSICPVTNIDFTKIPYT